MLAGRGGVQVQVSVGEPEESGQRSVSIYSRSEQAPAEGMVDEERAWICHAAGMLGPSRALSDEWAVVEQQAEKLNALGKLSGNLSHELNNPASAAQRAARTLLGELRHYGDQKYQLGSMCLDADKRARYGEWPIAPGRRHHPVRG